ncbi:MAG TPA: hypothetical protein VGM06_26330 [Polyangiaceae bacterium]
MSVSASGAGIQYALVCLDTGAVLEVLDDDPSDPRTDGLAAASSELLRSAPSPDWSLLFARLGSHEMSDAIREVILMSPENVYIVERLSDRPDLVLVAVSVGVANLGEALSGIRTRLARLRAA